MSSENKRQAGRPKGLGPYGEATKPMRIPLSMIVPVSHFLQQKGYQLPVYSSKVQAGFPSPADDHIDTTLDLNQHLIKHPSATFIVKAAGDSMVNVGIHENDLLIVDRSIEPTDGKIVIAAVDGYLTVKRLSVKNNKIILLPENEKFSPIEINPEMGIHIWGVVTNVIHAL